MVKRLIVVVAAVAALLLSLTACQDKASNAASVGKKQITESVLNKYVVDGAKPYTESDSQTGQSYTVLPRHEALQVLIITELFDEVLAKHGGEPTDTQVNAEIASGSTAAQRKQLSTELTKDGYTEAYRELYFQFQGKISLLSKRLGDDSSNTKLVAALRGLKTKVSVNPRYGKWDDANLSLNESGSIPSFVTLPSAAAAQAAA